MEQIDETETKQLFKIRYDNGIEVSVTTHGVTVRDYTDNGYGRWVIDASYCFDSKDFMVVDLRGGDKDRVTQLPLFYPKKEAK